MRYRTCLVAALASLCSGCIVLPMPGVLAKPHNRFAGKFGPRESSAPLRPEHSNQADVARVLGRPDDVIDVDKKERLQNWYYQDGHRDLVGVWVWFVPVHGGQIQPITREYELEIDFDGLGKAKKFVLTK